MPVLSLRIDFEGGGRLGPGKARLLEAIAEAGSISAGARAMGMSYKRAWDLVEETGRLAGAAVVETRSGGSQGGGATLTPAGKQLLATFREIEKRASEVAAPLVASLAKKD
jgi:molybdate transport system regulatory protein